MAFRSLGSKAGTILLGACGCSFLALPARGQSDKPAEPAPSQQTAPNNPAAAGPVAEVSTHDATSTFKVRVNLVLVRVVARDAQGHAIGTLHKEDFRLFDKGKAQVISTFAVERPGSHTEASRATETPARDATTPDKNSPVLIERYAAMLFDDLNLSMEDALVSRQAATKFLEALQPSDRVALFMTSGQREQDFTDDRGKLTEALLGIIPRPLAGPISSSCPEISFYEADLIVNKRDDQALAVATQDALECAFANDPRMRQMAQNLAEETAHQVLPLGEASNEAAFRRMEEVVRRMTVLPGQRTIVLVSPGFFTTFATRETTEVVDRATRANVVINTIDARGLYATPPGGDISKPFTGSMLTAGIRSLHTVAEQFGQSDVMAELADGTGGSFFHNRNDLGEGMRQFAAAPEFSYVLGFSPQNLKFDGSFHTLKVTLGTKEKYALQARRGYFAPQAKTDPAESARKDIEEAIFSQEELRDLPIELQTQFFKKTEEDASVAVLTRVDLKGLRFRKADGRNQNNLTIATAIFDENGNFVTGNEKVVEMKLRDTTLERLSRPGIMVKSSFDVKPGTYMVRLVVRDSEAELLGARTSAMKIPF